MRASNATARLLIGWRAAAHLGGALSVARLNETHAAIRFAQVNIPASVSEQDNENVFGSAEVVQANYVQWAVGSLFNGFRDCVERVQPNNRLTMVVDLRQYTVEADDV